MSSSPPSLGKSLQPGFRLGLLGLASAGILLLVVAAKLEPDRRGYGTHEQLGLTPCFFHQWTGNVCPACGTTTAWAHLVRGELRQAVAVNLGGTLLCGLVILSVPWLVTSAAAGRWWPGRPSLPLLLVVGTSWLGITLLDWLRRWLPG